MKLILWLIAICVSGLMAILKLFGLQYSWVISFSPVLVLLGFELFISLVEILYLIVKAVFVVLKRRKKG